MKVVVTDGVTKARLRALGPRRVMDGLNETAEKYDMEISQKMMRGGMMCVSRKVKVVKEEEEEEDEEKEEEEDEEEEEENKI